MALIVYGTHVFTKFKGYYGMKEECPYCHRKYQKGYVRYSKWVHFEYIPLFPVKILYLKMCPICGKAYELTGKEAKEQMEYANETSEQKLEMYAKHILAKKPKGIMTCDTSYEFWVKDLVTGEEICIASDLAKEEVKRMKKQRGIKKLQIIDV